MAAICYNEIKYWREKLKNRRQKSGPKYPDLHNLFPYAKTLTETKW